MNFTARASAMGAAYFGGGAQRPKTKQTARPEATPENKKTASLTKGGFLI